MPILFKIFVFLLLQLGIKTFPANGETSINWDAVLLNRNVLLTIEADPVLLEQALSVCSLMDISCKITKETSAAADGSALEKASVVFNKLANTNRTKIMDQLQLMQNGQGSSLQLNYQYQ